MTSTFEVAVLPSSISFQDAASFPMQLATVGSTFFLNFGLSLPSSTSLSLNHHQGKGILIYGASSAVGTTMVQFASQWGFTVFAVASGKHEDYIKALGANYFFARDQAGFEAKIVAKVKKVNLFLHYGVDCISSGSTFTIASEILSKAREPKSTVKLATLLPWPKDTPKSDGVKPSPTAAYEIFSKEPQVGAWLFNKYLTEQLAQGLLKPSPPVQIVEGGLGSTQKAWDLNKEGVSAKKLVVLVK